MHVLDPWDNVRLFSLFGVCCFYKKFFIPLSLQTNSGNVPAGWSLQFFHNPSSWWTIHIVPLVDKMQVRKRLS